MSGSSGPHPARAIGFGAGDYAFNLFWQTVTLYLLFFYTDALGLTPEAAGLVMMVGAIADGLADLAIGIAADRWRLRYRRIIAWWAAPLAMSFVLLFQRPAGGAEWLLPVVMATHVAFRILYALVNLPYAAWSTRVSPHARDRTLMSGSRMTFGALGAVTVAWVMPAGGDHYAGVAMLLAGVAALVLWIVVWRVPETIAPAPPRPARHALAQDLAAIARNRAFLMLCAATFCATVAGAIIGHSVLYYFAHVLLDAGAGKRALAVMGVIGAVAVPLWTMVALRWSAQPSWLAAACLALLALAVLPLWPGAPDIGISIAMLAVIQVALSGFHLAAWALLPMSVDQGEARTGVRVEATAFSLFMLVQKIGLGLAALFLGLAYAMGGYAGGVPDAAGRDVIAWVMIAGPAIMIAAGGAIMMLAPLRGRVDQASVNMSDTPSA